MASIDTNTLLIVLIVLGGGIFAVLLLILYKVFIAGFGSGGDPTKPTSTQLGPYRNLSLLSDKGGMAKVYRAFNSEAGRECVLKVLRSEMLGDADTVKKFQREAEILQSIKRQHPEAPVVSVYTSGTISTQFSELPFIELEYIPGKTDLADYLKQHGKMISSLVESVVVQIIRALLAAHDTGAIHRDLKPGNILLYDGDPKRLVVCDFGVAKQVDS